MATADARLSVGFSSHPKTKRLYRALGAEGPLRFLYLVAWAAQHRTNGDLRGIADADIELAIDWPGKAGDFVAELRKAGFLDGGRGKRSIHDWATHQPWLLGAQDRTESARKAAKARWDKRNGGCGPHAERIAGSTDPQCPISNTNTNTNSIPEPSSSRKRGRASELGEQAYGPSWGAEKAA